MKPLTALTWKARFVAACAYCLMLGMALVLGLVAPARATSTDDLDIGSPQLAGGTTYQSGINGTVLEGVTTISGGGAGIGGTSDQFHFNRGFLTGNGTVVAEVTGIGGKSGGAKCGVMLRGDVTAGAVFADVVAMPENKLVFQWRTAARGACAARAVSKIAGPVWVKVARQGSRVFGFYGRDGVTWTQIGKAQPIPLPPTALAGAVVTASRASELCTATFTHVAVTPALDHRYLHTHGNQTCDRAGKPVILCGANVGGWLVTEGWMCGESDTGDRFALERLEARFGAAKAATLINAWRDHWFTDRDFDAIKSYGFNAIRVPFSWRNMQDANGQWYRDANGSIDFSRFDWVVQEAAKRGMYVILDYHVWPGQQADYGRICQGGEPGTTQRSQSAAIWAALAAHFKGNGTIAGFDLINEPTGSNDYYDAHRAFYAAVRAADPDRMCIAEWVNTADFAHLGWTNTMCSGHYPAGNKTDLAKFVETLPKHNEYSLTIPCFVGECKADDSKDLTQNTADMAAGFNQLGWSWTSWTYKGVNVGGWSLFNYDGSVRYNLATDSYESILADWQNNLVSWQNPALPANYHTYDAMIAGYKQGAADAASAGAKLPS